MNFKNFDAVLTAKNEANEIILAAVGKAVAQGELPSEPLPNFKIEIPADVKNGDFATNVAMVGAKALRLPPRKIAEVIVNAVDCEGTIFEKAEIAGPGFINFFLSHKYFENIITAANEQGKDYGRTTFGKGEKVNVEFVSANPTGPMHLGNARGGALGDCLADVMAWAGYDITREFYVNDAGNQIEKFGDSLSARYMQIFKGEENIEFPENGYQGEDIKVGAAKFAEIHGDKFVNVDEQERKTALIEYALPLNVSALKTDLEKYRIIYDVWFKESVLHESGAVQKVVDLLAERGASYEKDGAIWYKATDFGEEKDEVLVRANGIPTYFTADIAYHYDKLVTRGFNRAIDVWGADHHGHVARMKGALNAIGIEGDRLEVVLMQLVRLVKDGEPVRMSKRTGKAITLTDLLEEVPIDCARFFFNLREPGSQMEFDLDLAVKESSDNPVYYVQYAHARICSILRAMSEAGTTTKDIKDVDLALLNEAAEKELCRHIGYFPGQIADAAANSDPAKVTRYVVDLATLYHKFYASCRVKDADEELKQARIAVCIATKNTIANALEILKISVPEKM